jgi:hypothetical protein
MAERGERDQGPSIHPLSARRTTLAAAGNTSLAATGTTLLAAAILFVDGSLSAPLGFLRGKATALIGFLDVLGLAFLLVRISRLVTAGHGVLLSS